MPIITVGITDQAFSIPEIDMPLSIEIGDLHVANDPFDALYFGRRRCFARLGRPAIVSLTKYAH